VNVFDVIVILAAVLAAAAGYRLGFVTRVLSWVGMIIGLLLGVRLLPVVFDHIETATQPRAVFLAFGLVLLTAVVGQAIGFLIGSRLRPADDDGTVTPVDGALGAMAGVLGIAVAVWLLIPVFTQTPGWAAREVSRSWVAGQFDDRLPDPPDTVQAFKALVGEDNFPEVFAELAPPGELGPPPPATGLSEAQAREIARSVVRVEGVACRRIQNGSGFVVGEGLVATNAHVVAGQSSTDLVRNDGSRVEARVVAFDPSSDLALLSAPGIDRPPLPIGTAAAGQQGGVFGHPGGQPLRVAPFAVARELDATGRDIYNRELAEREVLELAASLAPGDSGSALVTPDGSVVGVTFAIARDQPNVAYALDSSELQEILAQPRSGPVDTGPCVSG
jgi:S1-C subfamily serine protease